MKNGRQKPSRFVAAFDRAPNDGADLIIHATWVTVDVSFWIWKEWREFFPMAFVSFSFSFYFFVGLLLNVDSVQRRKWMDKYRRLAVDQL